MSIIDVREKTHGPWLHTAAVAQALKTVVHKNMLGPITAQQQEALDMICSKMARIIAGNANCADHWVDISGYARLTLPPGVSE